MVQLKNRVVLLSMSFIVGFAAPQTSLAASDYKPSELPGITLISPQDFFKNSSPEVDISKSMPEIERINAQEYRDLERLSWDMARRGITMGLGINNNFTNFFDLYGSYIVNNPAEPEAQFGKTIRTGVGRLHFPTHDAVHIYLGQIGPSYADVSNKAAAKKRLVKILMDKEGLASAWTSWYHVKRYWDWRNATMEHHDPEKFEKYNRGIYFVGPISRADFTDLLMSQSRGDILKYYSTTRRNVDIDYYRQVKDAQVPLLIPDLEEKLGKTMETFAVKYGTAAATTLSSYFRPKTGYLAFKAYAEKQADFYLQDWYVEWVNAFKVGESLSALEKGLQEKVTAFKNGRFAEEVQKPREGVWEVMQLRNEVNQLGRKLIEMKFLSRDASAKGVYSQADVQALQSTLNEAAVLSEKLLQRGQAEVAISDPEISRFKTDFDGLIKAVEKRFPVDRYIPSKLRLAHASYENFWRDPVAVVMPRPSALTSFMSGSTILSRAREIRREIEKAEMKGERYTPQIKLYPNLIGDLEHNLAVDYLNNRKGAGTPEVRNRDNYQSSEAMGILTSEAAYIGKLNTFRAEFNQQITKVFLPQVLEYEHLKFEDRAQIIDVVQDMQSELNKQLNIVVRDYRAVFLDLNKDTRVRDNLRLVEGNVSTASHMILNDLADILNKLEKGKNAAALKKELGSLKKITAQFRARDIIELPFVEEYLRVKVPFKGSTASSICSYITKFCLKNEKISKAIGADYLEKNFVRKGAEFVVDADQSMRAELAKMPKNAVVFVLPNHDYGILDGRIIAKVSEGLAATRTMVLTTNDAYPHLKFRKLKDRDVFFKQDKFFGPMLNEMKNHVDGRIVMGIFPEGVIQYWNAQMPRTVKWGAFAYARRAAHALKGKKPVYIVRIQTNGLEHVTSPELVNYRVQVDDVVRVPDEPVSNKDAWVIAERERVEKAFNDSRAREQIDLIDRGTLYGTKVRKTAPVRDYVTIEKYLEQSAAPIPGLKCEALFR